jgi:thymidylate synthase ThyX
MKKISAEIIADSIIHGHRLITYVLTYPRFIHAELMTHRVFSRNSASSRAIPFEKMIKSVHEDPFIPIAWQKDHKGMQGTEYVTNEEEIKELKELWLQAADRAIWHAKSLNEEGLTKQLCNRILEPFLWHTVIVTASEWDNFFELRCPKYQWQEGSIFKSWEDLVSDSFEKGASRDWVDDLENTPLIERLQHSTSGAEIHIQALAEAMWDAKNESTPKELKEGEWHIPFGDRMNTDDLHDYGIAELDNNYDIDALKVAVAVARCARLSYMTFEGEIDYAKDIKLHDTLLISKHMSPFEHCAKAMTELEYYSFVKGEYPTTEDQWGIVNYEMYPFVRQAMFHGDRIGVHPDLTNLYGWCNNFRGFIQYRYLI